jgi:MFS family permease
MPPTLLRSLSHRNFRLFFFGQSISLIGTWMQQVAMSWLVYKMTESAWWLGVVAFSSQIPSFFLAPFAGVVVDHTNRHRLVIGTQVAAMIQAVILTVLTIGGFVRVEHIVALSVFMGVVNAFDMPGRQAFLSQMIERAEDLSNAIALNSSMFNGARLIGPALAGIVLASTSPGFCFLVNALSFVAVLIALLAMRVTPRVSHKLPPNLVSSESLTSPGQESQRVNYKPPPNLVSGMLEGFAYAFGFRPIRSILLLVAFISLVGVSYAVLLPLFATDVLGGREGTYGALMVAGGVGAFTGALLLASRKTVLGLGRWITFMPMLLGAALIGLSFVGHVVLAFACVAFCGFAVMMQMASSNTVLQTIVDEDKRGRVMSLYTMAFMGTAPLGSLLAGFMAERVGPQPVVQIAGIGCVAASLVFATQFKTLRAMIRPIYRRMGILPEVATGIQQASQLATPPEGK